MNFFNVHRVNLFSFLICICLLAIAAYLQYNLGLKPCPLCILQRAVIGILGLLFLTGSLFSLQQRGHRFLQIIIFLTATIGALIAGRQVWIEHLPADQVPDCGANLKTLFSVLPFNEAFQNVFAGTGHCAEVTWRLLGFSIPSWTLLFFLFFMCVSLWHLSNTQNY